MLPGAVRVRVEASPRRPHITPRGVGDHEGSPEGMAEIPARADHSAMTSHRVTAGLLALGCILLAILGEALVLTHTAGALGLILLPLGAAAGIGGWIALGMPRHRADIPV